METLNIATLARHFSDEAAAWELVEKMRWPDGPVCPHCGDVGRAYFIKPRSGQRSTSTGKVSYRRLWKCKACRKPFSVLVGTIFERSQVPLSKWLLATYMMSASKNGVAANELRRTLGVTQPTAWFMLHRLREAMNVGTPERLMSGTVVADETWIGGNVRNRHASDPRGHTDDKTPVLSLVSKQTGEVRSQVVTDVSGHTLRKAMANVADLPHTVLHTDGAKAYEFIEYEFAGHEAVNHVQGEYVRDDVSTNQAENFFSQLKRSLDGTHHRVSTEHLPRYLAEFDFRHSTRKLSDTERMERLMGQVQGKRLTYRRVTAA